MSQRLIGRRRFGGTVTPSPLLNLTSELRDSLPGVSRMSTSPGTSEDTSLYRTAKQHVAMPR